MPPPNDDKKVSRHPNRPRTDTKEEATGHVLEVDNPFDLWYLCQKIEYALGNPMTRSDGVKIYQRVVSLWIRQEAKAFKYMWPWIAEVGYDMTTDPPSPIMSQKEPYRVSEFPLSQYSRIRNQIRNGGMRTVNPTMNTHEHVVDVDKSLVDKFELEDELIHPTQRKTGLMRIPDVIALEDFTMTNGAPKFSQGNLSTVIEIKFPNDRLWEKQRRAYIRIAGDINKFRLMRTDRCGNRRRRREWEEAANALQEPAFVKVREAVQQNQRPMGRLASAYGLIISLIEEENISVKRLYDDLTRWREEQERRRQNIERYGDHVITAGPSAAEMARREEQRQRTRAGIEMVLAGPFAVAAVGTAAAPLLAGGAISGAVTTSGGAAVTTGNTLSTGGRVLYTATRIAGNPTVQRVGAATAAANQTIMRAAASERTDFFLSENTVGYNDPLYTFLRENQTTYETFFYWPDATTLSYQVTDFGDVISSDFRLP